MHRTERASSHSTEVRSPSAFSGHVTQVGLKNTQRGWNLQKTSSTSRLAKGLHTGSLGDSLSDGDGNGGTKEPTVPAFWKCTKDSSALKLKN